MVVFCKYFYFVAIKPNNHGDYKDDWTMLNLKCVTLNTILQAIALFRDYGLILNNIKSLVFQTLQ